MGRLFSPSNPGIGLYKLCFSSFSGGEFAFPQWRLTGLSFPHSEETEISQGRSQDFKKQVFYKFMLGCCSRHIHFLTTNESPLGSSLNLSPWSQILSHHTFPPLIRHPYFYTEEIKTTRQKLLASFWLSHCSSFPSLGARGRSISLLDPK